MEAIILIILTYFSVNYFTYALILFSVLGLLYFFYKRKKKKDLKDWASKNFMDMARIRRMDGFQFEDYVASQFRALGIETKATPKSGDFGVDLIVADFYGVQLKNYKNPVGVAAIQEAYAGSHYYKKKPVVMVSNHYTRAAVQLASSLDIELIDIDDIRNWADLSHKRRYNMGHGMYELVRQQLKGSSSLLRPHS